MRFIRWSEAARLQWELIKSTETSCDVGLDPDAGLRRLWEYYLCCCGNGSGLGD
jgi:hypothetical protein